MIKKVVSIMLTEQEIEDQIEKKTKELVKVIKEMVKTKDVKVERLIDERKEPKEVLAITITLENDRVIKETLDIYETRNKRGEVTNVNLLSTPKIVTMSYLFGYLDNEHLKNDFSTLK